MIIHINIVSRSELFNHLIISFRRKVNLVDLISQRCKLFLFSSSYLFVTNQKTYRTNIIIWGQLQEGTTMAATLTNS